MTVKLRKEFRLTRCLMLDLVRFPVLSQIRPQATLFKNLLKDNENFLFIVNKKKVKTYSKKYIPFDKP